jgi:hypothetical protein
MVNKSKCAIGATSVVYLAHIISAQGVAMDAENVKAVQAWQQTCMVHEVCGFLDLTSYYPKFICSYAEIVAPRTQLLKWEAFCWTPATTTTFKSLKMALTAALVLQLPDFMKTFIV